jgi:hypothetical protein
MIGAIYSLLYFYILVIGGMFLIFENDNAKAIIIGTLVYVLIAGFFYATKIIY